jgi:hypothetical protein
MLADPLFVGHRVALQAAGHHGPWLVLLDIDSTLMDTAPRNAAILQAALGELTGLEAWRTRLPLDGQAWDILSPLRKAGLNDEDLLARLHRFWRERFFTDEWVLQDQPYPGAAAYLHRLKDEGFQLAYLTGRHSDGMEAGTRESFVRHGLPAGPTEVFFFKPTFEEPDREFKASVCHRVAALGTLVAALDNEPANANVFRQAFPSARVLWLDTVTSPAPEGLLAGIEITGPELFQLSSS